MIYDERKRKYHATNVTGGRQSSEFDKREDGGKGGGYRDRYDDRRGGYDDRRGGYDDRRGGYGDRDRYGYDRRERRAPNKSPTNPKDARSLGFLFLSDGLPDHPSQELRSPR